jgi:hypothetical protein
MNHPDLPPPRHKTSHDGFLLRDKRKQKGQEDTSDKGDTAKPSKFLGVSFQKSSINPCTVLVREDGKKVHLGNFPTEEAAALAYLKWHLKGQQHPKVEEEVKKKVEEDGLEQAVAQTELRPGQDHLEIHTNPKPGKSLFVGVYRTSTTASQEVYREV